MAIKKRVSRRDLRPIALSGTIAGVLAGVGMIIVASLRSVAAGAGFWLPLQLMAATVVGEDALAGGVATVFVGLALHLVVSILFGILFSSLHMWSGMGKPSKPVGDRAVASGVVYATAIWAVMTFLVVPRINPLLGSYVSNIPLGWYAYHLIFGTLLFVTPFLRERLGGFAETSQLQLKKRVA